MLTPDKRVSSLLGLISSWDLLKKNKQTRNQSSLIIHNSWFRAEQLIVFNVISQFNKHNFQIVLGIAKFIGKRNGTDRPW